MSKKRTISRRNFLGQASCAAVGSTAFLSSILNLGMINTLSARPHIISNNNDYKAMVCILLAGGCDSFNMLVPKESSEFSEYQAVRGGLALGAEDLLTVNPTNTPGRSFGIHGGMSGVESLFNSGDLSFVSNIGTLIEPVMDVDDLKFGGKKLPLGLYSHADQIMQWQTSVPQNRSAVGVGGRMADILKDMGSIDNISMNISLDGKNRFQAGNNIVEFALRNDATVDNIGIEALPSWYSNSGYLNDLRGQTIDNMVEDVYSNIFQDTYSSLTRQSIESMEFFKTAFAQKEPNPTIFSDTRLSKDLKMIADIISVQQQLGHNRQIFFTTFGGWDHHDEVLDNQGAMLPVLSNALAEFNEAINYLDCKDDVVTFTISDFGRTLTSNGNGSDHAWGGNQIIMGGPINGGNIFGNYPNISLNDALNIDERGRFIPTTSVDEFYAELALWFGASPNDLNYILPNLCNFYSAPASCSQPISASYAPIGMFT